MLSTDHKANGLPCLAAMLQGGYGCSHDASMMRLLYLLIRHRQRLLADRAGSMDVRACRRMCYSECSRSVNEYGTQMQNAKPQNNQEGDNMLNSDIVE